MAMTREDIVSKIAEYDTAISNALQAQSYGIGGRNKVNANLKDLEAQRQVWQDRLDAFDDGSSSRIRYPIFKARS